MVDAALGHPQVQATTWGPGWQGYNSSLTLQANLRAKYGCNSFDVVFVKLGAFTGETTERGDVFAQWVRALSGTCSAPRTCARRSQSSPGIPAQWLLGLAQQRRQQRC